MSPPLRILLDMDGIVCDSLPHWLDAIYTSTGCRAYMEEINRWELSECPPLHTLRPEEIYGHLRTPGFTFAIPPFEGAVSVIQNLMNDGHDVSIVTARQGAVAISETYQWVQKHLPFMSERQLMFAYDKHRIIGDVLIDDKAANLISYKKTHPQALCLGIEYAHNRHLETDSSTAARDIELVEYGDTAWVTLYQKIDMFWTDPNRYVGWRSTPAW